MDDLQGLGAAQLTEILRLRLAAVGGLALEVERGLARELVRRARRAERLQEALQRLLAAGEAWPDWADQERQQHWQQAATLARNALQTRMGCTRSA